MQTNEAVAYSPCYVALITVTHLSTVFNIISCQSLLIQMFFCGMMLNHEALFRLVFPASFSFQLFHC